MVTYYFLRLTYYFFNLLLGIYDDTSIVMLESVVAFCICLLLTYYFFIYYFLLGIYDNTSTVKRER